MRVLLALVVVLAFTTVALVPTALAADPASISRDARGSQPAGDRAPLGGPPTPQLYLLGQDAIFVVGIALLVVAAALGVYTFVVARRMGPPRGPHRSH